MKATTPERELLILLICATLNNCPECEGDGINRSHRTVEPFGIIETACRRCGAKWAELERWMEEVS